MRLPGYRDYPRELVVNEELWSVRFVNTLRYDGQDLLGCTDPSNHTIEIVRKLDRKTLMLTFVHELLHAIEFSYDLDTMLKKKKFDGHEWIYAIEAGFGETVFENWDALTRLLK